MKRMLFTLLLVVGLVTHIGTPIAAPAPALVSPSFNAVQAEQTDPQKITVYVTRVGAKYHRDGCRYLSKSKIPMTLKDAAKKYEPCKICKPPLAK